MTVCSSPKTPSEYCAYQASSSSCSLAIDATGHRSSQKSTNGKDALERYNGQDSFLTDMVSRGCQNDRLPAVAAKVLVANSAESEFLSLSHSCSSCSQQAVQCAPASSPELIFSFNSDPRTPTNTVTTKRSGVILQTPQSSDDANRSGVALTKNDDKSTRKNASYCLASSSHSSALALQCFSFDSTPNDKRSEEEKTSSNARTPLTKSMSNHFHDVSWAEKEKYVPASANSQFSRGGSGNTLLRAHIPLAQEEEHNAMPTASTAEYVEESFYEVDKTTDINEVKFWEEYEEECKAIRASFSPFTESCSRVTTTTIGPMAMTDDDDSLPFGHGCSSVHMVPTTSTTFADSGWHPSSFSIAQSESNATRLSPSFGYSTGEENFNPSCVRKQTGPVNVSSEISGVKNYSLWSSGRSVHSASFPRSKCESNAELQEMRSDEGEGEGTPTSRRKRNLNEVQVMLPPSFSGEGDFTMQVPLEEKELPSRSPSPTKPQAVPYVMMPSIGLEPHAQKLSSETLQCVSSVLEACHPALGTSLSENCFKDPYIGLPPVDTDTTTASGRVGLSVVDPDLQSPSPHSVRDEPCCGAEPFSVAEGEESQLEGEKSKGNRQAVESAGVDAFVCGSPLSDSPPIHCNKKASFLEDGTKAQCSFLVRRNSRSELADHDRRDMVKELTGSTSFTSQPYCYLTLGDNEVKGSHVASPKSYFTMFSGASHSSVALASDASEKKPKEQTRREERKSSLLMDQLNPLERYVTAPEWLAPEPPAPQRSLSTFSAAAVSSPPSIRVTGGVSEQGREDTQPQSFCVAGEDSSSSHQRDCRQESFHTFHASQTFQNGASVGRSFSPFSTTNLAVEKAAPLLTSVKPSQYTLPIKDERTAGVTKGVVLKNTSVKHLLATETGVEPDYPTASASFFTPPPYPTAQRNLGVSDAGLTATAATISTYSLPSCSSSVEGRVGPSKRKETSTDGSGEEVRRSARPSKIRAEAGKTMALGGRRVLVEDLHLISTIPMGNCKLSKEVGRQERGNWHPQGERAGWEDGHQRGAKICYGDEMIRTQNENSHHGCFAPSLRRAPVDSVKLVERKVSRAASPPCAYRADSYNVNEMCAISSNRNSSLKEEKVASTLVPLHNRKISLSSSMCSASASSCFHEQASRSFSRFALPPPEFVGFYEIQKRETCGSPVSFFRSLTATSASSDDCGKKDGTPSALNICSTPCMPVPPVFEAPLDVCQDHVFVLRFRDGEIMNFYASRELEGSFGYISNCANSTATATCTIQEAATAECSKHHAECDSDKTSAFLQPLSSILPSVGAESAPFPFVVGQSYLASIDAERSPFKGVDFFDVGCCVEVLCSDAQEQRNKVSASTSVSVKVEDASSLLPSHTADKKSPFGHVIHGTVTHVINTENDPKWVVLEFKLLHAESTMFETVKDLIHIYSIPVQLEKARITYDWKICVLYVYFFSTNSVEQEKTVDTLLKRLQFCGKYVFFVLPS